MNRSASLSTPPGLDLFFLGNVRREIAFAAMDRRHETDAVLFLHHAGPAVLVDITPPVEMLERTGLRITFGGKKEELHAFLHYPNLGDAIPFFVVEYTAAQRFEICEFRRHII